MGKRGVRPQGKVQIKWSSHFAYAIGLLASDGCLSSSGRHIIFVSKDKEQVTNFLRALNIENLVGLNSTGAYRVQFSDVLFYRFLMDIGLMPNKSKVLSKLEIPPKYFFDFLRGVFDGDGSSYSYWDPRWKSSFMYYVSVASASEAFIIWLRHTIWTRLGVSGHVTRAKNKSTYQLKYAKKSSTEILRKMYPKKNILCLSRKRLKIERMLSIVGEQL